MFTRVGCQCLEGCWSSLELFLAPDITSRYYKSVGASAYPQWSFSAKLLIPQDKSSFTLVSITNKTHQVNLRSLCSPRFVSFSLDENEWWLLNLHLSYKPPSFWSIMFWSGGNPRYFNHLKRFRYLTYPVVVYFEGIIIQGRQLPSGLPVVVHSWLRRKWGVMGASVHTPIQMYIMCVHTVRRSIYDTRRTKHPYSPICWYERCPSWKIFMDPLHQGIVVRGGEKAVREWKSWVSLTNIISVWYVSLLEHSVKGLYDSMTQGLEVIGHNLEVIFWLILESESCYSECKS